MKTQTSKPPITEPARAPLLVQTEAVQTGTPTQGKSNPCANSKTLLCAIAGFGVALSLAAPWALADATAQAIEQVEVKGKAYQSKATTGDAAQLLAEQGVEFSNAGGISSLPILRGLNDERVKLVVDGAESTSACGNHMNPALSYIDASRVSSVEVLAGLTPVSMGGDSIAGTIVVESEPTRYAESADKLLTTGSAGYFYRSNSRNDGVSLQAVLANQTLSLTYSGSWDKAESYRDGDGNTVLDTLYESQSHNLTLGWQGENQELSAKLTHQEVPHQGFPNQYMDMVGNTSNGINLRYQRDFAWGRLNASANWQDVDHEMGFFTDEKPGTMPMVTEGRDIGYKLALALPVGDDATLRLGHEFHRFELDDYWPAVAGSMMMGPMDYININDGQRDRLALYAELDQVLNEQWQLQMGLRYEHLVSDTGGVQPYNTMSSGMGGMGGMAGMGNADAAAAMAFNAIGHQRKDDNLDITLLAKYQINAQTQLEFGIAQKTRSPSLYERYSWGRGTMSMAMIGWYGDGNGYVGDPNLKPEVATTAAATFTWQGDGQEFSLAPYYTHVDNYIDAVQVGSFNPRMAMMVSRPQLQFTNVEAELWGVELRGKQRVLSRNDHELSLSFSADVTRGKNTDSDNNLYHIMPLNTSLSLVHQYKQWSNTLQWQWVDEKSRVDELRLANTTDEYSVLNLTSQLQWNQFSLSAGVSNLLGEQYQEPLGGVYLSGWIASDQTQSFAALPGRGRSVDLGIRYQF
ncbi:TonB-dependent receptor plug domain-containing protein [Halioxenophilus aromaticivorans]|uniref:TonB-dependent receptor n=1 Tax=Halioxenophilus aromaticivorans TaxID=1306992 RepID=A0AAV3U9C0_9ALTE